MGKLRKVKENEWNEEEKDKPQRIKIGRKLCRMPPVFRVGNLVAVGGKELDLQSLGSRQTTGSLFSCEERLQDFSELRVPVWISDLASYQRKQ